MTPPTPLSACPHGGNPVRCLDCKDSDALAAGDELKEPPSEGGSEANCKASPSSPALSASAMTPTEQIDYLATRIMGYKIQTGGFEKPPMRAIFPWNPLKSWDDWRRVEEKVMEDDDLWNSYEVIMENDDSFLGVTLCQADLPTRGSALISAHKELHP